MASEDTGLATIPDFWRAQAQASMRPISIVVSDELAQDRQKLILIQHDHVVEAVRGQKSGPIAERAKRFVDVGLQAFFRKLMVAK